MTVTPLFPWNFREDCLESCVRSGYHHFIGWRYVMLTDISGEDATCVESTDSNEIWRGTVLRISFLNLDVSHFASANATGSASYPLLKLCVSI